MNRWTLLILATGLLLPAPAPAGPPPLGGAFGICLGEPFDPALVITRETDRFHFEYYLVEPPRISPDFQHYGIYVTPHSRRIYRLTAWGRFAAPARCHDAAARVAARLTAQGGRPAAEDFAAGSLHRLAEGRSLTVACAPAGIMTNLRVTFTDTNLAAEALR